MSKNLCVLFAFYCKASDNNTNKLAIERRADDDTEAAAAIVAATPEHLITKNQIDKNNSDDH